ncbi:MAG: signal peptidase I, partial [Spirochaetales bacterium]|nr:signal peptidase I [Spirochaetales bacterium]
VLCAPPYAEMNAVEGMLEPVVGFFTLQKMRLGTGSSLNWESELTVERIIGLPGDTVVIEDFIAYVKPARGNEFFNERAISDFTYSITLTPPPDAWKPEFALSGFMEEILLSKNEYFVLGDNRTGSSDSRHYGPLSGENIKQKVLFRYWPLRKAGAP